MIRNLILTILVLFFVIQNNIAQAEIFECPDSEEMAICDLGDVNGYTFSNPDPANSNPPGGSLCGGGVFNNPGWFSFVAGSEDIELTVIPLIDPVTMNPMCDTVPGGQTGIQVALWEGCPETSGTCVAGDANCSDQPVTLSASGLTIGEIYNLVIDGCAGSVCTVMVQIQQSQPFDIPDVDEVDLFEPEYNVRGGCDSALPDGVFCAGIEINVSIDNEVYENLGAVFTWTIEAAGGNADPSTVEWSSGSFNGTGTPAVIGDLNDELGASLINLSFQEPGVYEICLTEVDSECDDSVGEVCTEITIITPGDQDFGEYEVCVLDLLAGWDNNGDLFDEDGNPWGAGEIDLQQVLSAPDGLIEVMVQDDCGCEFNQFIKIIPVGSLDREEVTLFLMPCQLPYQWFDVEIDEMEQYEGGEDIDLIEASAQRDHEGERCDSLVTLFVQPVIFEDSILVGDCTPMGTEFTFIFTAIGPDGLEIDFNNVSITWIDSTTNMPVGTGESIFLNSGTYYISFSSTFEDPNYVDDDLAGIDRDDDCIFTFGPYTLMGGSSSEPTIFPYDTTRCTNDLNNIVFVADTVLGTTYNWMVPPGIPFTVNTAGDSLTVDWTNAMPTDTVMVSAANDCGESEAIALPLDVVQVNEPTVIAENNSCVSDEFMVEYNGDQSLIMNFEWDFGSGNVTSGDPATGGPLGVTFPMSGSYTYFLTITDIEGCASSEMFEVTIEDPIEAPVVTCQGDPDQIVFSWNDTGADDYTVIEVLLPMGATGTLTDLTEYTVTGLNPADEVIIEVIAVSSTSCGDVSSGETSCLAGECDFSGVVVNYFPDNLSYCQNHPDNQIEDFDITLPPNVTGLYSGNGIVDAVDGIFDPNDPTVVLGQNEITFTYMDDADCEDSQSIIVVINEIPVAEFTPSVASVCVDEVLTLDNFNSDPNAVWDYGQDAVGDFTSLSYTTAGVKEIKLVVIDPMTMCGDSIIQQVEVRENIIEPFISCSSGLDFVDFNWDDVIGVSSYDVEVSVNSTVIFSGSQANSDWSQTGLNEGDLVNIQVTVSADNGCGMFVVPLECEAQTCYVPTIELSASQQQFCANDILTPVTIDVQVDLMPATGVFQGPGISDPNVNSFDPALAGVGDHTVIFNYTNPGDNCQTQDSISFTILEIPSEDFMIDQATICIDETATITYSNTLNNLNPQWVLDNSTLTPVSPTESVFETDIASDYTISLSYGIPQCPLETVSQTITVVDTISAPTIICEGAGTEFINFGWNDQSNVDEYEIYFDGDLVSTQTNSEYMLSGLEPVTSYELTVIAVDNDCGSRTATFTCETVNCYIPTIALLANQQEFCSNEPLLPVTIDVEVDFTTATGTFEGPGIADSNINSFDPALAGIGEHTVIFSYTNPGDNCVTQDSISFAVFEVPNENFAIDQTSICIDETATITYSNTLNNFNPQWVLDNSTLTPVSPTESIFETDIPSDYDISLTYGIPQCPFETVSQTITVVDTITFPTLRCEDAGTDFIEFGWNDQSNVDEYEVYFGGSLVSTQNDSEYMLSGLDANTSYDLTVVAIDNECGNRTITITCETPECVPPTFTENIPDSQCYDAGSGEIMLDVSFESNSGIAGNYTWDTPLVDENNMFTPMPGDQDYSFDLIYTEGNCTSVETVNFSVVETPANTLDTSVDQQVICISSTVSVTAQDAALTDETASWDFGDPADVNASGSGFGPYELTFNQAGTYNISLVVDNEGCPSREEMVTIIVEDELVPPALTCENEQVFSLDFSWDAVDCASDYVVIVDGTQVATVQNTSYTLINLNESQSVDIQIEAVSECACENVMSSVMTCSTNACPSTSFSVSSFDNEICLDATASPFNISITPDNLPGNGSGTWTGVPISSSGTVDPSTASPATYQLDYNYSEDGCDYNYSTQISFVEAPSVNVVDQQNPLCETDNFGYVSVEGAGGTAAYMYSIDQGPMQNSGEFADLNPGSHTINIVDANGCINSTTVNISPAPLVSASINGPTSVILDNDATYTINTNAPDIDNIVWTVNGVVACEGPNCTEYTIFQALSNAEILVQVFYSNACMVSAQLNMTVREIQAFYIPNIFSPSSSDVNAVWTMYTKGSETFVKSVKIYNRWGNLVHTLDINDVDPDSRKSFDLWDGYIEDDPAVTEVYIYLIDMEIEGIPRVITGSLTVVR